MLKEKSKRLIVKDWGVINIIGLGEDLYQIRRIVDNKCLCVYTEGKGASKYEHKMWVEKEKLVKIWLRNEVVVRCRQKKKRN